MTQSDQSSMIDRVYALIEELHDESRKRRASGDESAARNLSLAITHMEDAALRIGPPGWYRPNPRGHCAACDRDVALRRGGELREHTTTGCADDPTCAGSGYTPAQVECGIKRIVAALADFHAEPGV